MPLYRRALTGLIAAALAVLALPLVSSAQVAAAPTGQTRYVSTTGDDGTDPLNTCLDQADPCATIQNAVDQADDGDTVQLEQGTYDSGAVIRNKALTVQGDTSANTTIKTSALDVPFGGFGDVKGGLGVFATGDGAASLTVRNLSIVGSREAPTEDGTEAGIFTVASAVTGDDFEIRDTGFAGVLALASAVELTDVRLADNTYGVLALASTLSVDNGFITGSEFPEVDGGFGTGLDFAGSTGTVTRTTVTDGDVGIEVGATGGFVGSPAAAAAADPDVSVVITDSTMSRNALPGLANFGNTVAVDNSTIADNGDVDVYSLDTTGDTSTTITRSTIAGVTPVTGAAAVGAPDSSAIAAFTNDQGSPQLANFWANGLAANNSTTIQSLVALANGKSAAHTAPHAAPSAAASDALISMSGSIVDGGAGAVDCAGDVGDDGWNVSADAANSCQFSAAQHSQIKTDPKLGELADNGGPTDTRLPAIGSHALNAVTVGDAGCVAGATDQRGVSRPQGEKCDAGSVEVVLPPVVIHPDSPLPDGTVGKAYRQSITATGGKGYDYVFSLAPGSKLPAGLTLDAAGLLSGTPKTAGDFSFTVSVDDPTLKTYRIHVAAAAPTSTSTTPSTTTSATTTTARTSTSTSTASTGTTATTTAVTPTSGTTGPHHPNLPNTGAPVGGLAGIGLAALLAGLAFCGWAVVRRRQGSQH